MNFRKYSTKEIEDLITKEQETYAQALRDQQDFDYVKVIYMKIKELKKALLLIQCKTNELVD